MDETTVAERKMEMHLRMLYSQSYADFVLERSQRHAAIGAGSLELLGTFDRARLDFEREQRIQSLSQHLRRQALPLWEILGESESCELVRRFADGPEFWQQRGRSMLENLCLFACGVLGPAPALGSHELGLGEPGVRELARVLGIVSGLSERPDAVSPWADGVAVPPELRLARVVAAEAFMSRHELVGAGGHVALGSALEEPRLVFVLCFDDRSSLVGSMEGKAA